MPVKRISFNDENDFFKLGAILQEEGWFFRGQPNHQWHLEPSFERYYRLYDPRDYQNNKVSVDAIERDILKEYELSIYYSGLNYKAQLTDKAKKMFDLQHHGCATRLLDITDKFNIAAFFAAEHSGLLPIVQKISVWCFNQKSFYDKIASSCYSNKYSDHSRELKDGTLDDCFGVLSSLDSFILLFNANIPGNANIQSGHFLFGVRSDLTFWEQFASTFSMDLNFLQNDSNVVQYDQKKQDEYLNCDILQFVIGGSSRLPILCEEKLFTQIGITNKTVYLKGLVPEILSLNRFVKGFPYRRRDCWREGT